MPNAPRNRAELIEALIRHPEWPTFQAGTCIALSIIEELGLRIVPKEPTEGMVEAMAENDSGGMIAEYRAALDANPFAPEKPND